MPARQAISVLTHDQTLRVWSFLITLFGDLARDDGDRLSGATLSAITGRVGIKPEAMRVALHRLRKDGWLESHRMGRAGWYGLSDYGRQESRRVTGRIYATGPDRGPWHCLLSPENGAPDGIFEIAPGAFVGRGPGHERKGALWLPGSDQASPEWLRQKLVPRGLEEGFQRFETRLQRLDPALGDDLPALDVAAIRGLVVHEWRRLLLRCPDLPDALFGEGAAILRCRRLVGKTLDRLGPVALADLTP